jgi:hypothetical protein
MGISIKEYVGYFSEDRKDKEVVNKKKTNMNKKNTQAKKKTSKK